MEHHHWPGTDVSVSPICLGTAAFGATVAKDQAFALLDRFWQAGGNVIDTARAYAIWIPGGEGISEQIVGEWMHDRHTAHDMVVVTKGGHPAWEQMDRPRLQPDAIISDCEASLKALQLERISVYLVHRDDPSRPVGEILETLETLVKMGKVHWYGCSNWSPERMQEAMEYARAEHLQGLSCNQAMWSLAQLDPSALSDPTMEWVDEAMVAFHQKHRLPLMAYSAQAEAVFSRVEHQGWTALPQALQEKYDRPVNRALFNQIRDLSHASGYSVTTLALASLWSMTQWFCLPVFSTHRLDRLDSVIEGAQVRLNEDELTRIWRTLLDH